LDDIKPQDISMNYSIELLSLVSTMLTLDREERPTAVQVKVQLTAIAIQLFQPKAATCRVCEQVFSSRKDLLNHLKDTGHKRKPLTRDAHLKVDQPISKDESELTIRGVADAPIKYYYDDNELDAIEPSPCMVCDKQFNTKRQFFGHLHGVHHYRGLKYVLKRKAENGLDEDVDKEDERLVKWIRKDMTRHDKT
jgi:tRNA U54 and U55 pseudouridine synthase Pus10